MKGKRILASLRSASWRPDRWALSLAVLPLLLFVPIAGGAAASAADAMSNACGCHQDSTGLCLCALKARCGCPGQCEPKGCEEKREKALQREIASETRRAEEADRRQRWAAAKESDDSESLRGSDRHPEIPHHPTSKAVRMTG